MGMKQRLAIGRSLLNDPEIIILDEPINGLDPSGIQEIRELIKSLSQNKGITFLISSHILSELQKVATNYGIISKGKLIEQISTSELNKKLIQYILITSEDTKNTLKLLKENIEIIDYNLSNYGIEIFNSFDKFNEISGVFQRTGGNINSISYETETLESYFMDIIGGDQDV